MKSFLIKMKREEYNENVKYRFQLIKLKENEWAVQNGYLLEKLQGYEKKFP